MHKNCADATLIIEPSGSIFIMKDDMNNDYTDITLILDRSGSMITIEDDMNGAVEAFIKEQRNVPGKCLLSAHLFDDLYETVFLGVPIADAVAPTIAHRGCTALYDAIGNTINGLGRRLAAMPENERPGKVIVVIVSDGQENASRTFTVESIRPMVSQQRDVYKWQFIFLGANMDSYAVGATMGLKRGSILNYGFSGEGVDNAMLSLNSSVGRARCMSAVDYSNNVGSGNVFTEAEQSVGDVDAGLASRAPLTDIS